MPKTRSSSDFSDYAPVADRIALFWEKHPEGRILTDLISREKGEITFCARIYRNVGDDQPCATGWAAELIGDGDINEVACLENTETSAVGRALANLGFLASRLRPSAEEMAKVTRVRARASGASPDRYPLYSPSPKIVRERQPVDDDLQTRANMASDALRLIAEVERAGISPDEVKVARDALRNVGVTRDTIEKIERTLRAWLDRNRNTSSAGDDSAAPA
jgi:hypothetical protein